MRVGSLCKYWLVVAIIMILASPSDANLINFIFGPIVDHIFKEIQEALSKFLHLTVGGGTAVVIDAIKLNQFNIGPTLTRLFFDALIYGVPHLFKIGWYIAAGIIGKILEIIKFIVKGIWKIKYELVKRAVAVVVPVVAGGGGNFTVDVDIDIIKNEIQLNNSTKTRRSAEPRVQVLRGSRDIFGNPNYMQLEDAFNSATLNDRMDCLPMVFCAIYADPEEFVTPVESQFKRAFRSFFNGSSTPSWAAKYVKATELGESFTSNSRCQDEYSFCTFSPNQLRTLITQATNYYLYGSTTNDVRS
ncbi:hypothetical protein SK128_018917 [Halocaridina rubra]|uniref:Uncharacterized protein n=1 Tax=Halocaridina rubra TaxID=373956 RepID=A0AAN9A841_HALRR